MLVVDIPNIVLIYKLNKTRRKEIFICTCHFLSLYTKSKRRIRSVTRHILITYLSIPK